MENLETRMETMEGQMGNLETRMETMEGQMGNLEIRMETMEGQMKNLETRMETMEGQMGDLEARVRTVEQKAAGIELQLENGVRTNIQLLAENFVDLTRKLNQAIPVADKNLAYEVKVNYLIEEVQKLKENVKQLMKSA